MRIRLADSAEEGIRPGPLLLRDEAVHQACESLTWILVTDETRCSERIADCLKVILKRVRVGRAVLLYAQAIHPHVQRHPCMSRCACFLTVVPVPRPNKAFKCRGPRVRHFARTRRSQAAEQCLTVDALWCQPFCVAGILRPAHNTLPTLHLSSEQRRPRRRRRLLHTRVEGGSTAARTSLPASSWFVYIHPGRTLISRCNRRPQDQFHTLDASAFRRFHLVGEANTFLRLRSIDSFLLNRHHHPRPLHLLLHPLHLRTPRVFFLTSRSTGFSSHG